MPRPTSVVNAALHGFIAAQPGSAQAVRPVTSVRVVLVTMDSHLVSTAARAEQQLQRDMPGLTLAVHSAADWCDKPEALQRCRDDIASGDIIIVTMLFLEDHFQPVLADLKARREHSDAMICALSAAEVTA